MKKFLDVYQEWKKDNVPVLAAAFSFYFMLALGPLLLVIFILMGWFFEQERAREVLITQLSLAFGTEAGPLITSLLNNLKPVGGGGLLGAIGIIVLGLTIYRFVSHLQYSMNKILVEPRSLRLGAALRKPFVPFVFVAVLAIIMIFAVVLNTVLVEITTYFLQTAHMPRIATLFIYYIISFLLLTFLFSGLYRYVPYPSYPWKHILAISSMTSLLLIAANSIFSIVVRFNSITTAYGAAGSVMILLIWTYVVAQIILLGAELLKILERTKAITKPSYVPGLEKD